MSKRNRALIEPGNRVQASWRARLADHLGLLTVEGVGQTAASLMRAPRRLAGLASACAIAEAALPEREPHQALYDGLLALLAVMEAHEHGDAVWPAAYVRWELGVLGELGFGLDLTKCASTGATENLVYVSPKTGRAVSAEAGEPYKDRLLALPAYLVDRGPADQQGMIDGLTLTRYFLQRHVFDPVHKRVPAARDRLASFIANGTEPPAEP